MRIVMPMRGRFCIIYFAEATFWPQSYNNSYRQKASLTYIQTSSYSLVKRNAQTKQSGSQYDGTARQEGCQRSSCWRWAGDDGRNRYESERQEGAPPL